MRTLLSVLLLLPAPLAPAAEPSTMGSQIVTQLVGIAAVGLWSAILTWILLKLVDAVSGLRVAGEEETEGLDTVLHNEKGYSL